MEEDKELESALCPKCGKEYVEARLGVPYCRPCNREMTNSEEMAHKGRLAIIRLVRANNEGGK